MEWRKEKILTNEIYELDCAFVIMTFEIFVFGSKRDILHIRIIVFLIFFLLSFNGTRSLCGVKMNSFNLDDHCVIYTEMICFGYELTKKKKNQS